MKKDNVDQQNELELLRKKVAELEAKESRGSNNYIDEIQQLKKQGKGSAGRITYKDIHDHKNIPLYHTNGLFVGKMVGPIHPGNAEEVYDRFQQIGVKLSIYKPTAEQVERYKESDEYKKLFAKFMRKRESKDRSKKESEVSKLTKEIARMSGMPIQSLNQIKSQEEVISKR